MKYPHQLVIVIHVYVISIYTVCILLYIYISVYKYTVYTRILQQYEDDEQRYPKWIEIVWRVEDSTVEDDFQKVRLTFTW